MFDMKGGQFLPRSSIQRTVSLNIEGFILEMLSSSATDLYFLVFVRYCAVLPPYITLVHSAVAVETVR